MTSQNQPWLSFSLFNTDYVIKECNLTTRQSRLFISLHLQTEESDPYIQHGMSSFFPHLSSLVLTLLFSKGVPALFRWLSKKYPKISVFFYIRQLVLISLHAQSALSSRKMRQKFKTRMAMT